MKRLFYLFLIFSVAISIPAKAAFAERIDDSYAVEVYQEGHRNEHTVGWLCFKLPFVHTNTLLLTPTKLIWNNGRAISYTA